MIIVLYHFGSSETNLDYNSSNFKITSINVVEQRYFSNSFSTRSVILSIYKYKLVQMVNQSKLQYVQASAYCCIA